MLLTLSATSLQARLEAKGDEALDLADIPAYAREMLGLYGLNLHTTMLAGADAGRLDAIREAADKASCPCLVLVEPQPQPVGHLDDDPGEVAVERMKRVMNAAHRLGCNSAAFLIEADLTEDALDFTVDRVKRVIAASERLEVNLLLMSGPGLVGDPDRLTDLIKKIGGFRIGTFPDFAYAAEQDDPVLYLKRVVPYASALNAATRSFKKAKNDLGFVHDGFDVPAFIEAVESVGYQHTLAIDYQGKDPETGVVQSRKLLEHLLGMEPEE